MYLPILIISRREILSPLTIPPFTHSSSSLNIQVGQQPARLTMTLLSPELRCPRGDGYRLLESKDHLFPSDLSPQLMSHLLTAQLNTVTLGLLVGGREIGSRTPKDTKIRGCSRPLYKMAYYLCITYNTSSLIL